MIATRRRNERADERGLALLDVLLGMAVFALIAVIAVQSMGMFREKTYVTRALSDAKQLATGIEAQRILDKVYPDTVKRDASNLKGVNLTAGSYIAGYSVTNGESFRACVMSGERVGVPKAYAIYDSSAGKIIESGQGTTASSCDGTGVDAPAVDSSTTPTNVVATVVPGEVNATVTWDEVPGAAQYAVYLDNAATPAWTGTTRNATLNNVPAGDHQVVVTATQSGTEGPRSQPAPFTIEGDNDYIRFAHPVALSPTGAPWTSRDYNNTGRTVEGGEPADGAAGMWWKLSVPRATTIQVDVIQASDSSTLFTYPKLRIWKSSATDVAALGTVFADNTGGGGLQPTARWASAKNDTYLIRVSSENTTAANYRSKFRLKVTAGPANDGLDSATVVTGLSPDTSWASPDVNNTFAGPETNEPANGDGSMWWSMTAPRTATYTVRVIQAADGSPLYTYPKIYAWKTTTDDVAALGTPIAFENNIANVIRFAGVAGETYKIRASTANSTSTNYRGAYRLEITPGPVNDSLADATEITVPADATPWHSPDVRNTYADPEAGEAAGSGSMWWTFTAPRSGTYTARVVAAADGSSLFTYPKVDIWESTTTDMATLGAFTYSNSTQSGGLNPVRAFAATAGKTYKVRISTSASYSASYRTKFRLQLTAP